MQELLDYCCTQLLLRPRELVVHQPLPRRISVSTHRGFSRLRFLEQQKSILSTRPDHPQFGRGYLLDYELHWTPHPSIKDHWSLRIVCAPHRLLSPREAILLASVSENKIPFAGTDSVFRVTKARMLDRDRSRRFYAVHVKLRYGITNVYWDKSDAGNYVYSVTFDKNTDLIF